MFQIFNSNLFLEAEVRSLVSTGCLSLSTVTLMGFRWKGLNKEISFRTPLVVNSL
jgi:hypothetical protein